MLILKLAMTLAVLWHTLSFAAGGVYAALAYRALFFGGYQRGWTRVLRSADWQLWASGFLVIGLGIALSSAQHYIQNPKLMAKGVVVLTWFASTQGLRRFGFRRDGKAFRWAFLASSSVNVACWFYGAFLGVAKPLAYGAVSLSFFLAGFVVVIAISLLATLILNRAVRELRPLAPD
jgi:hypothetical protein